MSDYTTDQLNDLDAAVAKVCGSEIYAMKPQGCYIVCDGPNGYCKWQPTRNANDRDEACLLLAAAGWIITETSELSGSSERVMHGCKIRRICRHESEDVWSGSYRSKGIAFCEAVKMIGENRE